jgi:hypothetical protein
MKNQLLILLLILFGFCGNAQETESKRYTRLKQKANYQTGYVVLNDYSKLEGLFKIGFGDHPSSSIVDFVSKDGTKIYYYPKDLMEYSYSGYRMLSNGKQFFELIRQGKKINLYKNTKIISHGFDPKMGGGVLREVECYYFKKKDEEELIYITGRQKFRNTFSEYFSDCPELKNKILDKSLKSKNWMEIFEIYENCK